ncbi:dehydrogenase/reductase SDR family member 4 [Elysia marginata]|uniref:Dehydrogenase/reductase SDR family member 4 n=1 Tax=Elysia marginata TaxID=1093978 RepID=A0AAV4FDG0_9GAST|nr:dehydrogenase/reductase SDR family member 4 [Elysia marginata]
MSDVTGKTVVVSGSSSGIGEGIAILFASLGANVTVCGRDEARLQEVAKTCEKAARDSGHTSKVLTVPGDMTSAEIRKETIQRTVEVFGGLDVLVANHGVHVPSASLETTTEENFDTQINITVKSKLFLIKEAVPYLEKKKGCIVVVSSILSTMPGIYGLPYNMSMSALDHMVRCLALELAPKGIRVNAINPTLVATRIFRGSEFDLVSGDLGEYLAMAHPLEGRFSTVEEQARAVLFLASEAASFISGECLKVDGAATIKGNALNFYTPPSTS